MLTPMQTTNPSNVSPLLFDTYSIIVIIIITNVLLSVISISAKIGISHPDRVVETNTLSSVPPPDITYTLSIPENTINAGLLSALQLEAITYACQVLQNTQHFFMLWQMLLGYNYYFYFIFYCYLFNASLFDLKGVCEPFVNCLGIELSICGFIVSFYFVYLHLLLLLLCIALLFKPFVELLYYYLFVFIKCVTLKIHSLILVICCCWGFLQWCYLHFIYLFMFCSYCFFFFYNI